MTEILHSQDWINLVNERAKTIQNPNESLEGARPRAVTQLIGELLVDHFINDRRKTYNRPWRPLETDEDVLRAVAVDNRYIDSKRARELDKEQLVFMLTKELDETRFPDYIIGSILGNQASHRMIISLGLEHFFTLPS